VPSLPGKADKPDKITIVIPARLASERFPRKILADETGRPLVQHVAERVSGLFPVVIAADSSAVQKATKMFGTRVVLTSETCRTGTERVAELTETLGLSASEIVINVQGDEPEIDPEIVRRLARRMTAADRPEMGTVVVPYPKDAAPGDPSLVKAIVGRGDVGCLWFSRLPIPFGRSDTPELKLHVGIYAYRVGFLRRIAATDPTPAERAESLEQLRALETGARIACVEGTEHIGGIDTIDQYRAFVSRYKARQIRAT
jgi:3-deoxy-manno-octulosonate cytidylyltransferase (CMP-KDO synthetase)